MRLREAENRVAFVAGTIVFYGLCLAGLIVGGVFLFRWLFG